MGCGAGAFGKAGRQDVYLPGDDVETLTLTYDQAEKNENTDEGLSSKTIPRSKSGLLRPFALSDDAAESVPSTPRRIRKKKSIESPQDNLCATSRRTKSNLMQHIKFLGDDDGFATELCEVAFYGDPTSRYRFMETILSRRTKLLIRLVVDRSTAQTFICREHNIQLRCSPGALGLAPKQMAQQVMLARSLNHINILRIVDLFMTPTVLYEIAEHCTGKKLFEHVIDAGKLTDRESANIMHQTLSAVEYMHGKDVCHRDIKPEHIIFENSSSLAQCQLRIIDFSTACSTADGEMMTRRVSTPYYASPEVLQERYSKSCDLWASGVIMHLTLLGYPRREEALDRGLADAKLVSFVTEGRFEKKPNLGRRQAWDESDEFLSPGAIALLDKLLKPQESIRITASEAMEIEWLRLQAQQPNPAEVADGVPWSWTPGECADRGGVFY